MRSAPPPSTTGAPPRPPLAPAPPPPPAVPPPGRRLPRRRRPHRCRPTLRPLPVRPTLLDRPRFHPLPHRPPGRRRRTRSPRRLPRPLRPPDRRCWRLPCRRWRRSPSLRPLRPARPRSCTTRASSTTRTQPRRPRGSAGASASHARAPQQSDMRGPRAVMARYTGARGGFLSENISGYRRRARVPGRRGVASVAARAHIASLSGANGRPRTPRRRVRADA